MKALASQSGLSRPPSQDRKQRQVTLPPVSKRVSDRSGAIFGFSGHDVTVSFVLADFHPPSNLQHRDLSALIE
jgi:hypothetical protein